MAGSSFASMFGVVDEKDQERWDKQREEARRKKVNPLSEAGAAASSALLRAGRMATFTEFQAGASTAVEAQQRAKEKAAETAPQTAASGTSGAAEDRRAARRNARPLAEEMGIEQTPPAGARQIER